MRTINEIGERHGIPETTARRYTKRFAEFLSGRKVGNAVKYPLEDEELILKIARLYDEGESTEEIREILAGEHPRTIEVEGSDSPRANPQLLTAAFMAQTQALQQLADTLEDMQKQQEDIEQLKKRQRDLESRLEDKPRRGLLQRLKEWLGVQQE